tara:strand:- start:859 stop:1029 length:171 start_codon:yes stop_codon:yes gene_type:complete
MILLVLPFDLQVGEQREIGIKRKEKGNYFLQKPKSLGRKNRQSDPLLAAERFGNYK